MKQKAFAAVSPGYSCLGEIQNISRGGLAFRYLFRGEMPVASASIDIFLDDGAFYLNNIPCKVIADMAVDTVGSADFLKLREQHVAFGDLNTVQQRLLLTFIGLYAEEKHT